MTARNLAKLQNDISHWRTTQERNLKQKEKRLAEEQEKVLSLEKELAQVKAEKSYKKATESKDARLLKEQYQSKEEAWNLERLKLMQQIDEQKEGINQKYLNEVSEVSV